MSEIVSIGTWLNRNWVVGGGEGHLRITGGSSKTFVERGIASTGWTAGQSNSSSPRFHSEGSNEVLTSSRESFETFVTDEKNCSNSPTSC